MLRKALLLVLIFSFNLPLFAEEMPLVTDRHWTRKYDQYFRKYSKRFFGPAFDWHWFKAQGIAESGLRANARSWTNAKGIMQLMPRTFAELKKKNPDLRKVTDPRWNISAGIYYDSSLFSKWKEDREFLDRVRFMLGSYNAGFRTILRAQKVSRKKGYSGKDWDSIKTIAPQVSRWRDKETLGYINKIEILMGDAAKQNKGWWSWTLIKQ
ncbi:MAG: transglycosylase SLT domain-containing protein [Deltaproteobacteria bacterium]|jgi:soluble lytic murein transglycosylase-like protein|nr:transglycosylase SLT domain-containing protein [Deltaproteobacteria bacterium]